MEATLTLKFWHGGEFKRDKFGCLIYVGRKFKTVAVDPDLLGWWDLLDMAKSCGGYTNINSIKYHIPSVDLATGLRDVYNDIEVRQMVELGLKHRTLNLYVVHGEDDDVVLVTNPQNVSPQKPLTSPRKKLTPKRPPITRTRNGPANTESSQSAADSFRAFNPELFCRAFMDTKVKTDAITNNMAETFNGYIVQARTKHLIYMLEDIRSSMMQRIALKREEMEKSKATICPRVVAKIEKNKLDAAKCNVMPSSQTVFQVNYYLDSLTVDIEAKTCTCRQWDMCGYPCVHAVAAIFFCHKKVEEFVDESLKRDAYLRAYSNSIPPCEGERHWPRIELVIDPPPIKIGPGRPRKNRIKDPFEDPKKPGKLSKHGAEMTCSICNTRGHNKRRCSTKNNEEDEPQPRPVPQNEPPTKRARGRPKSDAQPRTTTRFDIHTSTAEPSRVERGGRTITTVRGRGRGGPTATTGRGRAGASGRGRSGTTGRGNAGARGGPTATVGRGRTSSNVPRGVGVVI